MTTFLIAVIGIASLGLLIFIKFFESSKKKNLNKDEYKHYWQSKIIVCLSDVDKYKLAIIEADKLMDRAFRECGLQGQTTGERLVSAGKILSDKEAVWQVHKLRNRLVHEMDVELNLKQTKRALLVFVRALKDLGAL